MASDYPERTKDQLQAELSERGLPVSGTKAELIKRLEQDDTQGKPPPAVPDDVADTDVDEDQGEAGDIDEDQGDAGDIDEDQGDAGDIDEDQGEAGDVDEDQGDAGEAPPIRAGGWIDRRDGRGWVPEED